jgi:hypothetical protein
MLGLSKGSLDGTQLYDQLHKEYKETDEEVLIMVNSVLWEEEGTVNHLQSRVEIL